MAGPHAVAPRRLHEQVVRAVVERILAGEYRPGDALPSEAEMCATYGVSRSSVREALRVLAEKGMIEVRHGLATRVNPAERWDFLDATLLEIRRERGIMVEIIRDLLEARRIVESEVAALAAERASSADVERLEASLATMRASVREPAVFADGDFAFHRALLEATGNRILIRMAEPIRHLLEYSLHTTNAIADVLERALDDHVAIYSAVRAGDPAAAREAMRRHLDETANDIGRLAGEAG